MREGLRDKGSVYEKRVLQPDQPSGTSLMCTWLGRVARSLVDAPCMTVPVVPILNLIDLHYFMLSGVAYSVS